MVTRHRLFLFHASNDKAVSPLNSIAYYTALYNAGIEKSSIASVPYRWACHFLACPKGKHGNVAGTGRSLVDRKQISFSIIKVDTIYSLI